MSYGIPPECNKRSFRFCKHNAKSAVGNNPSDRKFFEILFQKAHIDYYICPNCQYYCKGNQYDILLTSIEDIEFDSKGPYVNLVTNERLYLTKRNFLIVCDCQECINPEAWVKMYEPKAQKSK